MGNDTEWVQPTPHDLLVMVRDQIVADNAIWNQGTWFRYGTLIATTAVCRLRAYLLEDDDPHGNLCGTRACVFGMAVILGDDPRTRMYEGGLVLLPDTTQTHVYNRAKELLGLNRAQADWLSDDERDRDEVLAGLDALIADPQAVINDGSCE
jgi:hypothetical protein